MTELISIAWYCLQISFGSGAVTYSECKSEQHHRGAPYVVTERSRFGGGACGITVYGTQSTAWAKPVEGWVPCWVIDG